MKNWKIAIILGSIVSLSILLVINYSQPQEDSIPVEELDSHEPGYDTKISIEEVYNNSNGNSNIILRNTGAETLELKKNGEKNLTLTVKFENQTMNPQWHFMNHSETQNVSLEPQETIVIKSRYNYKINATYRVKNKFVDDSQQNKN